MERAEIELNRLNASTIMKLEEMLSDQRVTIPSGLNLPIDAASFRWALETLANNHQCFGIYLGNFSQPVGMICCDPVMKDGIIQPHLFEVSYLLDHQWWGHHIMTEAMQKFCGEFQPEDQQLFLIATTLSTNVSSQNVLKRVGFKQIATDRQGIISWQWSRSAIK